MIVVALWPRPIRLERDEQGVAHLASGRKQPVSVDLSCLVDVSFLGSGYGLRDEEGGQVFGPLDGRLRLEVREATARRRLELSPETEHAFLGGRSGKPAPKAILVLLSVSALVPLLLVGVAVVRGGGIELERDNSVGAAEVHAAAATPGAVRNPFVGTEPRELYLVGLDARSQRQLPRLAETLRERFGVSGVRTAPFSIDVAELDPARQQLDGWKIAARLLGAHQSVHAGRPAVVIAVTRLDMFFSGAPEDRFAYMTSGFLADGMICGGLISTARFDVWPGSEQERLGKMAGRLFGRCLGIEQGITIRSIRDVDRLDDRAGADDQTIATRRAERRALADAPRR